MGNIVLSSNPPASRPARKQRRQSVSPLTGFSTPPRIPLMPAILPSSKSIADALRPISMPPSREASGVKLCIREFPGLRRAAGVPTKNSESVEKSSDLLCATAAAEVHILAYFLRHEAHRPAESAGRCIFLE